MNDREAQAIRDVKTRVDEISKELDALLGSEKTNLNKNQVYEERSHFESLFNARISIQLVFSTLLLFTVYSGTEPTGAMQIQLIETPPITIQRILLIVGTGISIVLSIAVWRTYRFTQCLLNEIRESWPNDPYPRYQREVGLWNANLSLLWGSFSLTLLFGFLAFFGVRKNRDRSIFSAKIANKMR